jgi:hypothetical protein
MACAADCPSAARALLQMKELTMATNATKTDREIIEEVAEIIGGSVRYAYSGRGMYDATCLGIICDSSQDCIEEAESLGLGGAVVDSMGKQFIVYWPKVTS